MLGRARYRYRVAVEDRRVARTSGGTCWSGSLSRRLGLALTWVAVRAGARPRHPLGPVPRLVPVRARLRHAARAPSWPPGVLAGASTGAGPSGSRGARCWRRAGPPPFAWARRLALVDGAAGLTRSLQSPDNYLTDVPAGRGRPAGLPVQAFTDRRGRPLSRRARSPARPGAAALGAAPARPHRPAHPRTADHRARRPRHAAGARRRAGRLRRGRRPAVRAGAHPGAVRGLGGGRRSTWSSPCSARRWWRWAYGPAPARRRAGGPPAGPWPAGSRSASPPCSRTPRRGSGCRSCASTSPAGGPFLNLATGLGALLPVLAAQLAGFGWIDGLLVARADYAVRVEPNRSARRLERRSAWWCCCSPPARRWSAACPHPQHAGLAVPGRGRAPRWSSRVARAGPRRGRGGLAALLPVADRRRGGARGPGRRAPAQPAAAGRRRGRHRHRRRGRARHPLVAACKGTLLSPGADRGTLLTRGYGAVRTGACGTRSSTRDQPRTRSRRPGPADRSSRPAPPYGPGRRRPRSPPPAAHSATAQASSILAHSRHS